MEVAGLAAGAVALAGLFNNAIECFEMVQIGRGFEGDFRICELEMDSCLMRFARWGKSLGLEGIMTTADVQEALFQPPEDVEHAKALIEQILLSFGEAERLATGIRAKVANSARRINTTDERQTEVLETTSPQLHRVLRRMALRPWEKRKIGSRVKWAIYQEKQFRKLLGQISNMIGQLTDLFPGTKIATSEMASIDAEALNAEPDVHEPDLQLLSEIAKVQDPLLAQAVDRAGGWHTVQNNQPVGNFYGTNYRGFQQVNNSGTQSFTFN